MAIERHGCSERFACRVLGQSRSTQRRTPRHQRPDDPDRWLRDWLTTWAARPKNRRKGYRRAWADLRHEGHLVNRKRVQRVWQCEKLQVSTRRRRKRVGASTTAAPVTKASAPNEVWAFDFQFDATVDGRRFKIASMVDEYTRESLLDIVDWSITAEHLVTEIQRVIRHRGTPPKVLRCDNGPELVSAAVAEFCAERIGISYIPPGEPWNNGFIESFNNRVRDECLQLNQWRNLLEARIEIGDWKTHYNHHHRHSNLDYMTPIEYAHQNQMTQRL